MYSCDEGSTGPSTEDIAESESLWKDKLPRSNAQPYDLVLKGLEIGNSGIISAITNVTASLARKVYDDFQNKKKGPGFKIGPSLFF